MKEEMMQKEDKSKSNNNRIRTRYDIIKGKDILPTLVRRSQG